MEQKREWDKVFIKANKTRLENFLLWLSTIREHLQYTFWDALCVVGIIHEGSQRAWNKPNPCSPRNQSKSLVPPRLFFDYYYYCYIQDSWLETQHFLVIKHSLWWCFPQKWSLVVKYGILCSKGKVAWYSRVLRPWGLYILKLGTWFWTQWPCF